MKADKRTRANNPRPDAAPPPEPSDREFFRQAMRNVRPLSTSPAPLPKAPKPRARASVRRRNEAAALTESLQPQPGDSYAQDGETVSFRRNGIPEAMLKKLRGGHHRVEAEIDLHGMTVTQATQALRDFLHAMQHANARCIRIIHGKGHRSGGQGPVIKPTVQLALQKVDAVMAYVSARPADGGTGAMYVLLNWANK